MATRTRQLGVPPSGTKNAPVPRECARLKGRICGERARLPDSGRA